MGWCVVCLFARLFLVLMIFIVYYEVLGFGFVSSV